MRRDSHSWGDLVTRGQVLAPGMHAIQFVDSYKSWFGLGRWTEIMRCRGCRVVFRITGKNGSAVGKLAHRIKEEHAFHMAWTAVFRQMSEFHWAAKDNKMKLKIDLRGSVYGDKELAHGTVRREL